MDPRDSLEAHLRHIWEDLLGRRNIGIRDDFFQIGGHSLKAVALAAALSRIYGGEVPVRMIFDSRTIEGQAAFLRQNVTLAPPSRLVPLNTAKHGAAIYCVHPAGGLAHVYVDLSKHFDDGHQVYALQATGLDYGTEPLRTVEEIADLYVREIRRLQPSGPYHLAGLSMGGAVAYEMARQFDQAGDRVGLVALLDPTPARTDAALPYADWESQLARWTRNHVIEDAEEHLGVSRSEWEHLDADDQLLCYLDGAKRLGRVPADVTPSQYRRFLRVFGANSLAVDAYRPQQYSGTVHLFRTGPLPGTDETFGWGRVAAGLEMRVFSGRHGAVIADPIAIEVAGMLQENMDRSSITPSVHDHARVQGAH